MRQVEDTPKPEKALVDVMVARRGRNLGKRPAADGLERNQVNVSGAYQLAQQVSLVQGAHRAAETPDQDTDQDVDLFNCVTQG